MGGGQRDPLPQASQFGRDQRIRTPMGKASTRGGGSRSCGDQVCPVERRGLGEAACLPPPGHPAASPDDSGLEGDVPWRRAVRTAVPSACGFCVGICRAGATSLLVSKA